MKLHSLLYYRYIFRQSLIHLVISLVIAISIDLVLILTNRFTMSQSLLYVMTSIIWIYPIYTFIMCFIFGLRFKKEKSMLQNLDLYLMIKNSEIRRRVINSGLRVGVFISKKDQEKLFNEVANIEIEKQKKLLKIKRGEFH